MQEQVLEYFSNYFGGELTENTSDEDIMDAVYDLIDLTEAVLEAISPEELIEAKGKLTPHEVLTKLQNRQSLDTKATDAVAREVVKRKSHPERRTNVPNQERRDVDVAKRIINTIGVTGRSPTSKERGSFIMGSWRRNPKIDN